jgi:hypothetical protein
MEEGRWRRGARREDRGAAAQQRLSGVGNGCSREGCGQERMRERKKETVLGYTIQDDAAASCCMYMQHGLAQPYTRMKTKPKLQSPF